MARVLTLLRRTKRLAIVTVPLAALLYVTPVLAATAPTLGAAGNFTVLAGAIAKCTDGTIAGNVGAGATVIQVRCPISGTVTNGLAPASQARVDFGNAYKSLTPNPGCPAGTPTLTGTLAGVTLVPGTYCLSAEAKTGTLTLNGSGVYIFLIGTGATGALTGALTGTNFHVALANGAKACDVYWWVAEAATMTDSTFNGTILAGAAITFTRGTLTGRALAKADVTITGTAVTGCAAGGGGGGGGGDNEDNNNHDNDHDNDKDKDKDRDGGDDHHDGGGEDHHGGGGEDHHGGHHGGGDK